MVDIALVILLFPLAWALGASVIYFHISALVMLGLLLSKRNVSVRIPSIILPMVGLALAYLCSLMLNASGVGTTRLIASSYNLSIWFLGITITIVAANADLGRLGNDLTKAAGILCLVAGTGVVLAGLAWHMGSSDLILEAPLSRIAPSWLFEGDLFRQSTELKVLQQDWINGHSTVRSSFLAPYPTVLGAIAAWAIIFVWFETETDNPWHRWRSRFCTWCFSVAWICFAYCGHCAADSYYSAYSDKASTLGNGSFAGDHGSRNRGAFR